jgi:hypothetical protein
MRHGPEQSVGGTLSSTESNGEVHLYERSVAFQDANGAHCATTIRTNGATPCWRDAPLSDFPLLYTANCAALKGNKL